jgi:hypothetical protein
VAVCGDGERGGHGGQRGGQHQRRAETLPEPRADEHAGAAGEPADERSDRQERGPGEEDSPAPEQIGEAPSEQHHAAIAQQVG